MKSHRRLGVNVDHVATLRQARGGFFPSPIDAALTAQTAGADSIVAHLREDRRHIQDRDLFELKKKLSIPLNMEMSVNPGVVRVALRLVPHQVTLVPERRQERTTESGINAAGMLNHLRILTGRFKKRGIQVSLFLDPDPKQMDAAIRIGADAVEIHTGEYARVRGEARRRELNRIHLATNHASERGLKVYAGHGLDYDNSALLLTIPQIEEFNIGFAIISRSVFVGIGAATREMGRIIRSRR